MNPVVRWVLHLAVLSLVLIGLWLLNRWLDLGRLLVPPHPSLRDLWLPSLFLLVYVLSWLGWWLWAQLGPEQESPVFPDIDRAWDEAVRALDQANIDLTEAPLFLVLGRPRGTDEALFQGAQLRLQVSGLPRRADSPLHVYASREGIYVACPGAALLGKQSALMAAEPEDGDQGEDLATVVASEGGADAASNEFATLTVSSGSGSAKAMEQIIARAREQGRNLADLGEEEKRALSVLLADRDQSEGAAEPSRSHASVLKNRAEADLQTARLLHLCRLITRDRRPFCPINGILLLIPLAATRGDEEASQVGLICQRDLATVREATQVCCPVVALVCELETLPGFRELIARLPEGQRDRRMGQRFPLVPDLAPGKIGPMIESGVVWIGGVLVPKLVDRLWTVETPGQSTTADAVRGNVRLYELLRQIRGRMLRLSRVLIRACASDGDRVEMLGGCYLAGTGTDPASEQAFIPGVFRRLSEYQDFVAWTPGAVKEDATYLAWTRYGYIALAVLTLACLALAGVVLKRGI